MGTADPFSPGSATPPGGPFAAGDPTFVTAPKALLHDHLDGGLRPRTIVELAADIDHPLPADDPQSLASWFVRQSSSGSLERYLTTFPLLEAFVQSRDGVAAPERSFELIGRVMSQQIGLRLMSLSIARMVDQGGSPVAEAAMAKDLGTELEQLLVDELWRYRYEDIKPGPAADRFHEFLDINRLRSPVFTTAGGTNEVLRLLVGRQLPGWAGTRKAWLSLPSSQSSQDVSLSWQ